MRRRGSRAKFLMAALFTAFLWGGITPGTSVAEPITYTDMGYTLSDLGTLGGSDSHARGTNDKGQVVGYSDTAGNVDSHGFLYSDGTMTDLAKVVYDLFLVENFLVSEISADQIIGGGDWNGDQHAFILTVPKK